MVKRMKKKDFFFFEWHSIASLAIVYNIFSHHKQKTNSICYLDIYICIRRSGIHVVNYIIETETEEWAKKQFVRPESNTWPSGPYHLPPWPLYYQILFGWPSGLIICAGFCSDEPSGILRLFAPKCSDYIRHKAQNFSKSVRIFIWVRHLYSGVL